MISAAWAGPARLLTWHRYERLGYVAYGSEPDEWDAEAADGRIVRHRTLCTLMRKHLQAG